MRKFILLFICMGSLMCSAQKIATRNGRVSFASKTSISTIEALNQTAISVLDKATGNVEFAVLMKGFTFVKAAMQEHFNDDYVESDKFPKASYKGTITNLNAIDLTKNGTHTVNVQGNLTLHGVTKPLNAVGLLVVANGVVTATSEFNLLLSDYQIHIPSMVQGEISNKITIHATFKYQ